MAIDFIMPDSPLSGETPHINVYYGDEDVLTGVRAAPNIVRIWIAPKPEDWSHGMNTVVKMPLNMSPPDNAAVFLYFLNEESLNGFIEMLSRSRDTAFRSETKNSPDSG